MLLNDKKIDIIFLSTRAPYPPNTGHFQRTYNTIRQMSKFANLYFFGFYDKGMTLEHKETTQSKIKEYCKYVYIEELKSEYHYPHGLMLGLNSFISKKPLVAIKYYTHSMALKIQNFIAQTMCDVVHLDMLPMFEYRHLFEQLPFTLTEHNVEYLRLSRRANTENNLIKKMLIEWQADKLKEYEQSAIKHCENCIVMSESDKAHLSDFNQSCKYEVIPNGVDSEFYYPKISENSTRNILWVGNMADPYNRRGIEYFCKNVFEEIQKRMPDVLWTVVGKSPPALLQDLKQKYPDNIRLIGYVDDVRDYYWQANVLVIPLLSGAGTKLKVIEGMSMGVPIVTTSIGAEGIEVIHKKDIFICDAPEVFADSVITLLQNHALQKEIASNARKIAETKYDWNIIGNQLQKFYTGIVERR